jgi:capsular polysaccharide biosynthesis protein
MQSPINFLELLNMLKRRIRLIGVATLSITIIAGLMTYYLVTPMYEASAQILVNQPPSEGEVFTSTEVETSRELIETYNTIITSSRILDPTIQRLGMEESRSGLSSKISVIGEGESQVLRITVQDSNQAEAAKIANTLAAVFQEEVPQIMNIDNVSTLAEAEVQTNPSPVSPNIALNMGTAFIVMLGLGIGITVLLEFLDNTIKSESDIENELNISVLGTVSKINEDIKPELEVFPPPNRPQGSETYGA